MPNSSLSGHSSLAARSLHWVVVRNAADECSVTIGTAGATDTPIWLWPHLLSLDAPTVAVLWAALTLRGFALPAEPNLMLVLGLAVWAIYVADRALDARHPAPSAPEPARKCFYRRHRDLATVTACLLLSASLVAGTLLAGISVQWWGIGLGACVAVYTATVQLLPTWVWPREFAVAILFALGCFLPAASQLHEHRFLFAPACIFALLALINCSAIEFWEWQTTPSRLTRVIARYMPFFCCIVVIAALLLFVFRMQPTLLAAAEVLCGLALLVVRRLRPYLQPESVRVLLDVALLTPALLFVFPS